MDNTAKKTSKIQGAQQSMPAPPASDATDAHGVDLEAQLKELQEQVKRLTDIAGRAQADLQNAKMRLEKDADELRKFASQGALIRLLPVIDNFQRAFQHLPSDLQTHDWVKGISAIEQDFIRIVTEMGLKKINALGQPVDASCHEILMEGAGEKGKVVGVFEDGYELHGKVLRPAKVKVGNGEPPTAKKA